MMDLIWKAIKEGEDERKRLLAEIEEADALYYTNRGSHLTNNQYDALRERFYKLSPDHEYFDRVAPQPSDARPNQYHQVSMLSMRSVKDFSEVEHWLGRLCLTNPALVVQPKIDGLAATCVYEGGELSYIATRGDGQQGRRITHIADYVADIPKKISVKGSVEVRGELYLPKGSHDSPALRNAVVGLINGESKDLTKVRFAAYQCVRTRLDRSESRQIDRLRELGFHVVDYSVTDSREELYKTYCGYIRQQREQWPYETDGLVICLDDSDIFESIDSRWEVAHHHHYNIALKPPGAEVATVIRDIEWQVGRTGNLTPVAIFDEVVLGGVKISRALLYNYKTVKLLDLDRGDTVLVTRANDGIPRIVRKIGSAPLPPIEPWWVRLKKAKQQPAPLPSIIPSHCPSCGAKLEKKVRATHLVCPEWETCIGQRVRVILYYAQEMKIAGLGEDTIRRLVESGLVEYMPDIFLLTLSDLLRVEGFGQRSAENLLRAIEAAQTAAAAELLPKKEKSAWKPSIACTGKGPVTREKMQDLLRDAGYYVSFAVTRATTLLLYSDLDSGSRKLDSAREIGVPVMTYEEFFSRPNAPPLPPAVPKIAKQLPKNPKEIKPRRPVGRPRKNPLSGV